MVVFLNLILGVEGLNQTISVLIFWHIIKDFIVMGKDGEGTFLTCPRNRPLVKTRNNHENETLEKTVSFPHITPGSFIGFNMQHLRLSGKHHLKLTAKTQNPTHTYIRHYSETNKTKGYQSSLLFFPQVYLARKGNKHLLSFKLVRSDYICNRYNFVPVDWQEILGHILGREKTVPEVVSSV